MPIFSLKGAPRSAKESLKQGKTLTATTEKGKMKGYDAEEVFKELGIDAKPSPLKLKI